MRHRIKSFCINLQSHDFRRRHMQQQRALSGLEFEFFTAITPDTMSDISHKYDEKKARNFTGRGLLATEKACALSHITLWRQLQQDADADYYLILEDDIIFETDIAVLLDAVDLTNIDFMKLSGKQPRPKKRIQKIHDIYDVYRYAFGPLDTAAYLISKKAAAALENYCQTMHTPIDILMDRSYDSGVTVYGILPYPVKADFCFDPNSPFYTSIGERQKYAPDITISEKLMVKFYRLTGSLKRHLATARLHLVKE